MPTPVKYREALPPDLQARVDAAMKRGHGPECDEGDEDSPSRCVCEHRELAREIELVYRYVA